MTSKFEWKMASFAKGIDAEKALQELERIETIYGQLTAETILEASKPKRSLLHSLFEWDDSVAVHQQEWLQRQQSKKVILPDSISS